MSDKIYRTVTYEIEPSGDCDNCKSRKDSRCLVFDEFIYVHKYKNGNAVMGMVLMVTENKQCQACKDYLSQEKAKVRCDNCKYFIYDWMESECTKGNENTCGETFARDDWYYDNCQDREE